MKSKNQSSQKRKDSSINSNMLFSFDSFSAAGKSNILSAFPNYEKNILMIEECSFQFQDTEFENGIFVATLHFIALFNEQSKDQYNNVVLFNILSLTNFSLSKENQQDENLCLETTDVKINIFNGSILKISRIVFRNYTLSTLSMPKDQRIYFYSYDSSLFPMFKIPFSISQIFQFRYAALCVQNKKAYDHSIVQYFHSLMKSEDPIFNFKHIPNSLDRQQILPIFQSLIYIPTIFGISCRNSDTPSIISDISSLVAKSSYIRSIKLMNCNSSSDLEIFSQAILSNKSLPLEELYLNDNEFDDLSPLINSLSNFQSQMTQLSLTGCGLNDSSLELLGNCLLNSKSLQSLKYLGIGETEYKENSVKNIIKYIQTNSNLFSLDLSGSTNLSQILKSISGSSITDLNLSDCIFDDESVAQLSQVAQIVSTLNISGCDLNSYEVSDVISKIGKEQESLVSIKLNGLNFSKERSFVILRGFLLTDLDKWKSIEMNDTKISSNELLAYQALFLKMTHLEHLSFNTNFKEEDAKNVASLFEIKSLKSISLANCHLASIIPNIIKSKINKINLSNNDLKDQDALNLLSSPNLKSIKINDNSFKNFDNIVQVANLNPNLIEPPLKHGLSTIHRNSPYSKDFENIISKFNIYQHTALNEDLKIPYPFVQKDYEEVNLQIGSPSIYNLNKLNILAIENNSSSQELKSVDIYPEIEIITNASKKNNDSSIPQKKRDKPSSSNSVSDIKKKSQNNYSDDYEDQYNSDEQIKDKNNYFNEYSQYDDNQYDDNSQLNEVNQYDEDSQYEKDNQYNEDNLYSRDNQYDSDTQIDNQDKAKNSPKTTKKESKRNGADDEAVILSLLDSPPNEPAEHKQSNSKPNASYDTSNSESITQQNNNHSIPPQLEDDLNTVSEDNLYSKALSNPKNTNVSNSNANIASEAENSITYSGFDESDEEINWFKPNPTNNVQDSKSINNSTNKHHKKSFGNNYSEDIVNSSSTMKSSSASPSPKSQKSQKQRSKSNYQFDEEYSEENKNQSDLINPSPISDIKQQPNKNKSKYDVNDEEEEFSNNIKKKNENFIQKFRQAMYRSENSENEDAEKSSNSATVDVTKRKPFIDQEIDNENDVNVNNRNQNIMNTNRLKPSKYEESENESISDENQESKHPIQDFASKSNINRKSNNIANDIINDDYEKSNEAEYEDQDEAKDENYTQNNPKSKKNKEKDQIDNSRITPSKAQKVSKIPTPSGSGQRRLTADREDQNDLFENNDDDDENAIDEEENNPSQNQQRPRKRRSRIPSPFELHQSSPSNKRRKSDIVTDNAANFKSKIPGPRSPQRMNKPNIQLQLEKGQNPKQQKQQEEEDQIEMKQESIQNQKISRRVLFDGDENEKGSNPVDDEENTINNLNLSSNEEPMVHKNAHSILERHPSLSEEEEHFIKKRRMMLPRKVLNQGEESDNYNDTDGFSISSNSFSPQQSPPTQSVSDASQSKNKKMSENKVKKSILNDNENDDLIDLDAENSQQEDFMSPAPEESLSSAYDFVNLTSMLFSMPKKKSHNNQISPLTLAFSPPFLEDD